MAVEPIGNLVVRVGLNGAEFEKGLKNIQAKMNLAKSELQAVTSQFEDFGDTVDSLRIKQDNLSKIYQLQGERVRQLRARYEELIKTHGKEADATLRVGAQLNKAIAQYNRMGKEIDGIKDKINELEKEASFQESTWGRLSGSLLDFSERAGRAGESLRTFGERTTATLTTSVTAIGAFAFKAASDFATSQSRMQASLNITKKEAKELTQYAKNIWKEGFGENVQEATDAVILVRQQIEGLSGKQLENVAKQALILKETFGYELEDSIRATKALVENFGIDASKAFDYITVAAQKGGNFAQDLLDTISEYSVQFKSAGLNVDQMFNLLIQGAKNGAFNLDKVGDAVKEFTIRATDGSKTTADGFKMIGLNADEMSKKMAEGGDSARHAFMATIAALASMKDPLKQNQAGVALFGTMWEDLTKNVITSMDPMNNAIGNVAGATERAGKALKDNFNDRLQKAIRQIQSALIPLGNILLETVEPALQGTADTLKDFANWLGDLSPGARKFVVAIGLLAVALGPLAIILGSVVRGFGAVYGTIGRGISWFGKYRTEAALTNRQLSTLGTTATITAAKVNTASSTVSTASKGMSLLRGGAVAAGGALTMLGGTWGTVLGIATMFLPQILSATKNLFNFGAKATETGTKVGGFGSSLLGAIKNATNLSKILGFVRTGLGALGGPIGLLTTVGIPALITGGIKLYKHLQEQTIPTINSFGNKVSESTTKAVLAYKKLNDEATAQLNYLYWSGTKISQQTASQLVSIFNQMGSQIQTSLQNNFNKSYQSLSTFLQNSKSLSTKERQEILNNVKQKHFEEQKIVQEGQARIKQILETASREKRTLTAAEKAEINRIQDQMMKTAVQTMSKSEIEQRAILARLKTESSNITAQQAAAVVRNSIKARDGAIKEANKKYKDTVSTIIRERDVTGSISKQQADKLIKEAKRQRDEAVSKAKDMHKKVVSHAKQQAEGQVDNINWATGQVKTKWDKFVESTAKAINTVSKGLNWVASKLGLKWRIPMWKPWKKSKQYAKGTPRSGHPGGPAIVGEKGPELAYIPKAGVTLLGTRGPEFIPNLPRGTAVLPNKHTEKLLKSYGFPGYEDGVGDFFSAVLKGPKSVIETIWKKFKPNISGFSGTLSQLAKGIISFLKDKSLSFIEGKIKDFFAIGDNFKAGGKGNVRKWIATAIAITGVPASWLEPLVTIAMRESGGNPRAINLWDINAKRGTPSKGLMQTIDPTFNRYKLPGLNNIWNPVHNAVAAIRYIKARYGTVWNVPGIKRMLRGKGYVGYAEGTPVSGHPGGLAIVGEEGRELAYIPGKGLTLLGTEGPTLLNLPRGTSVLPNDETERLLKEFNIPGYADGVGNFRTTFTSLTNQDYSIAEMIAQSIVQALAESPLQILIENITKLDSRIIAKQTYETIAEFQEFSKRRRNKFSGK